MKHPNKIEGGCLCGEIRYESTSPPLGAGYCHCSVCRKAYGHLYAALIQFSRDTLHFTKGSLSQYQETALAKRGFCKNCGSSLTFSYDNQPSLFILAGSLDCPEDFPFDNSEGSWGHTFMADKVSWLEITDGLPQHAQSAGFLGQAESRDNTDHD